MMHISARKLGQRSGSDANRPASGSAQSFRAGGRGLGIGAAGREATSVGYIAPHVSRRAPQTLVRGFVILLGSLITPYAFCATDF